MNAKEAREIVHGPRNYAVTHELFHDATMYLKALQGEEVKALRDGLKLIKTVLRDTSSEALLLRGLADEVDQVLSQFKQAVGADNLGEHHA